MSQSSSLPPETCPCGRGASYDDCCGPLHRGRGRAETAEQLMRSRYSAAFHGLTEYMDATLHPSKRVARLPAAPETSARDSPSHVSTDWRHLHIVDVELGRAEDGEGQVEFVATYGQGRALRQLHERSNFVQEHGRWFYVDGEVEDRELKAPSRNDPCWCGGGKKFKRCHG